MKKLLSFLIILFSSVLIQGCLETTIISSAAILTKSATDPRSIGRQVDDGTLAVRVISALNKNKEIKKNARIVSTAYKGSILLTGQAPKLFLSELAKKIVINVKGVESVYNEIRVEQPINFIKIIKDTWITIQIKLKILSNNLIKLSTVKVITENGEVFLLGILSQEEGDIVAKIASNIKDVKHVFTGFSYN
ncbi:division/outer membrane stress-associated lipid-binding lipoprotein [Arsenophonus symbiont of Ornithomya chloropus]|uniref:division/outer membrane stress-associated lipid-binding lipoprotein n=1 Tax=Arsenophonus symbiont of Ornithomya chloropus TaxID=634121 RepID=UPI0032B1738B